MSKNPLSATQSSAFGDRLSPVNRPEEVPERWRGTPIEDLIAAHNFGKVLEGGSEPRLLIVSCIEYRFRPEIPHMYAYVIRSAGGRLSSLPGSEFALSYILAKGVRHIALIGHNDCGMTKVPQFKPKLVEALVNEGWEPSHAEQFIEDNAARFAMDDEVESLHREFKRLKNLFKKVEIAPLFVSLGSSRLHIPNWYVRYMLENS